MSKDSEAIRQAVRVLRKHHAADGQYAHPIDPETWGTADVWLGWYADALRERALCDGCDKAHTNLLDSPYGSGRLCPTCVRLDMWRIPDSTDEDGCPQPAEQANIVSRAKADALRSERDFFKAIDMDVAADYCEQSALAHESDIR